MVLPSEAREHLIPRSLSYKPVRCPIWVFVGGTVFCKSNTLFTLLSHCYSSFFFKVKKYMHLYIMYMCPLRPERTLDPLKLELHAVVSPTWALGTEKNS